MVEEPRLYRFEAYTSGKIIIEWAWLMLGELQSYLINQANPGASIYRRATKDEEQLYDDAYEDGYHMATIQEVVDNSNGLTYRVEFNKDADGEVDANGLVGHKMFECATCGKHKDLDTEVAIIEAGPWYLATLKNDVLWFNCFDCASLGVDISQIELEVDIDWDSNEVPDEGEQGSS